MKFMVVTRHPPRQGLLGVTPEKIQIEYTEGVDIDDVVARTTPPLYGSCYVILNEDVTTIRSEVTKSVSSAKTTPVRF